MMPRRPFVVVLFLAGNLLAVGCSGTPGLMTYPVTGSVVRGGKPVAEATVTFHPEQPWPEGIHRPLAITNFNGQFTLTTIQANDGAPVGDYRVTVELRAKVRVGEEVMRDGPNQLPGKFAQADSTPLRAKIEPGVNELAPFQLTP